MDFKHDFMFDISSKPTKQINAKNQPPVLDLKIVEKRIKSRNEKNLPPVLGLTVAKEAYKIEKFRKFIRQVQKME